MEHDPHFDVVYNPCRPLVVETPSSTSASELEGIEQAMQMWREAAPVELSLEPVEGARRIPVSFESGAAMVHGYYDDEIGEVIINRNLSTRKARSITLAHELGHAFDLRHVSSGTRRSLMNAGNIDTTITKADVAALMERWDHCEETEPAR